MLVVLVTVRGLDPRFMYDKDAGRYLDWLDIKTGKNSEMDRIVSEFRAAAVWIDRRVTGTFVENLDAPPSFLKKYEDEWTMIYVPVTETL